MIPLKGTPRWYIRKLLRAVCKLLRLIYFVPAKRVMAFRCPGPGTHHTWRPRAVSKFSALHTDHLQTQIVSMRHNHRQLLANPPVAAEVFAHPTPLACWPTMVPGDDFEIELDRNAGLTLIIVEEIKAVTCRWRWLRRLRDLLYPPAYWAESFAEVNL